MYTSSEFSENDHFSLNFIVNECLGHILQALCGPYNTPFCVLKGTNNPFAVAVTILAPLLKRRLSEVISL